MIKFKEIINEVQNIPRVGDFYEMGEEYDFDLVPIIRVNSSNKWIDFKHPKGHNHRIDFWNLKYGGMKGSKKIWNSRMGNNINDKA